MNRISNEQREAIVRKAVAERDAMLVAAPLDSYSPEDQAFFRFWYGHMQNDMMQTPLTDVSHATARYIWNAARTIAGEPEREVK